ncbi:MAG: class 1 fructose-bisphosphatase [Gammaproteobacteria bacterium]|uniref:class 1 fructose-bisphosphatase n=1 Tax=Methylotuvimicrobium sp. KM1 TaxID=3377707 RepID=UPI001D7FAC56|nr:class 1 fructose-bisphosphatase [Gammaproteobacteria bacterium]
MTKNVTLTRFIIEQQREFPGVSGTFTLLLNDIVKACKQISHLVNRGDLIGVLGSADSENVQGEVQKKLDIITNDIMVDSLIWTGHLSGMASEEVDDIIRIPDHYPRGKYLALFDPLDGSSNIDVNLTVGTIFSILRYNGTDEPQLDDFLQKGSEQVCAGFVLYGPSTMMILTTGHGVNGFTLDQDIGEFILTHPNMTIPSETSEFAINMSNQHFWEAPVKRYIDECVAGENGPRGKSFNMRWVASLVAEVFRILTRGGVFLYPYDLRDPAKPGRLRLMYEANPVAFIVEQAGGACSTGRERMLDVQPKGLHQRVPLILGSKSEVDRIIEYHQS